MNFSRTAAVLRDSGQSVEEALKLDLQDNFLALPLRDSLETGGWPTNPEFSIESLSVTGEGLDVIVLVVFDEHVATCCPAEGFQESRTARLSVQVQGDGFAQTEALPE